MIFVECSNPREQSILDQDFESEKGLFSVPHRKVNKVTELLQSIRKEYFEEVQFPTKKQGIHELYLFPNEIIELSAKIIELIDGMMKAYLSFSQLRNIFNLLHQFHERVMLYAHHFRKIQSTLQNTNDEYELWENIDEKYESERPQFKELFSTPYQKFSHSLEQKSKEKSNFLSTSPSQDLIDDLCDEQTLGLLKNRSKSLSQELISLNQRPFFERDPIDIENIEELDDSSNLSRLQIDKNTSSLYCPLWKKEEQEREKHMKDTFKINEAVFSESVLNGSNFVQDLSKLVHPTPSAMINESITEMIKRQQIEDQRKLNIICQSIRGQGQKLRSDDGDYQQKLKKIKLNQKLKNCNNNKNIFQKRKKKNESQPESIEPSAMSRLAKHMQK